MNQAATATSRPPAGSTTAASCCPVFSPFFMNTFVPQVPLITPPSAQQCFLGSQASHIQPLASIQPTATNQQQLNAVTSRQQSSVNQQQSTVIAQSDRSQQPQRLQDHSNHTTNINLNISNNYSTSFAAQTLSLQHLLANRHPATDCVALAAAALASANLTHHQQLQNQSQQSNQLTNTSSTSNSDVTTTNQSTSDSNTQANDSTTVSSSSTTTPNASLTNQVPLANFNSYNPAPQNLNINAQNAPQHQPVAAHLNHNHTNQHQQQSNVLGTNQIVGSLNVTNRPLATNTLLNSIENQQQIITSYRRPPVVPTSRPQTHQLSGALSNAQNAAQVVRSTISDESLNNLLNERFQASILNQIFANNQFIASLAPVDVPQQQATQTQHLGGNQLSSSRSQFPLPSQVQAASVQQQVSTSFMPQQRPEQVSNQNQPQQPQFQQTITQPTRLTQAPNQTETVSSTVNSAYQQPQQPLQQGNQSTTLGQHQTSRNDTNVQAPTTATTTGQQAIAHQQPSQQQQQSQGMPPIPFYHTPQVEQVLALLANPALFSHFFTNIYFQSGGLRSEQHQHPNPSHHFHHHMHTSAMAHHHHHHHHHGANGQANGQDPTIPVDSLAISESKPKGLNRAEIDSLTHYIHTDEKDSRTCVICLSKFELKSKIRPLSCNHAFHAKCVDKWLRANRTCPICRRDALKTYEGKIKRI